MKILGVLENLLKMDERFVAEDGALLKPVIYSNTMNMDKDLISLLLSNEKTKEHFFTDIGGVFVFDKVKFGWVIESKEFLPDSYTRYKNKIGLVDSNENLISSREEINLVWPYKDCIIEGGQSKDDQKSEEVFYNEMLSPDEVKRMLHPKVFTNSKRYSKNNVNDINSFDVQDNLVIKGNNLLAISSLLERYEGKIKCVYIDPPYNPKTDSNTFLYNNHFNRSSFLTFLRNRLVLTKRLLSTDGVLIVTIDKNEQPFVQVLLNEIFPENKYNIDCITIVHNPRGAQGTNFSYTHEYAIFITPIGSKSINNRKLDDSEIEFSPLRNWGSESLRTDAKNCFYPIIVKDDEIIGFGDVMYDESIHPSSQTEKEDDKYYVYPIDSKGIERKWRYARQSVEEIQHLLRAKKTKDGYDIVLGKDFEVYKTVWSNPKYDANKYGTQIVSTLTDTPFSFPKSLYAVKDCLYAVVGDDKNAIVLDFFAGSGTTAHALLEINKEDDGNRRFITIEQMDYINTITVPRLQSVIKNHDSGSFIYCELKELNQVYIDEIRKSKTKDELNIIKTEILSNAYISHKVDIVKLREDVESYDDLSIEQQKQFLMEIIDKNKLYVNYSEIDDIDMKVTKEEKEFSNSFYSEEE